MRTRDRARGFTLVEIVIVVGIISLVAGISFFTFKNMYAHATLKSAGNEVFGALVVARERTRSSQNDITYGVHIGTSSVTRFTGGAYNPSDTTNTVYQFEGGVSATSTIITAGGTVTFTRLSGDPSRFGTIYLRGSSGTTTVVIHQSGLIEYE